MIRKKIAVLGASYLQVPVVNKAKEMNIETHCFAWDNDEAVCKYIADYFYPISVLEKEIILQECKKIKIDGIVTIATDICIPTISYIADKLKLIANSVNSSILSTNKGKMREAFLKSGLQSPQFLIINDGDEIFVPKEMKFPIIIKPSDRSGSRGVSKVKTKNDIKNAIRDAFDESLSSEAVIEEYFEGIEVSVESISYNGKHEVITITDKITTGPPHFVEIEHHQPSGLNHEIIGRIKKETIRALNSLNITNGASHTEFRVNHNGEIMIIEVGARMGGDFIGSHLVQLSTGYDYLKAVLDVALDDFTFSYIQKQNNFSGVYFLSKETEYLMPFFKQNNSFDVEKKITNEELTHINNSNKRSGYLIYKHIEKVKLA